MSIQSALSRNQCDPNRIPSLLTAAFTALALMLSSRGNAEEINGSAEAVTLPFFRQQDYAVIWLALLSGVVSLAFGVYWYLVVKKKNPGTEKMNEVGDAIRKGSFSYLKQQLTIMVPVVVIVALLLGLLFAKLGGGYGLAEAVGVALFTIGGASASYAAGCLGMITATIGNQRTAQQARSTYKGALETAFQAGAVAGMLTVGFALIGACAAFLIFHEKGMFVLIGYGFGGSLAALFMRVGGGIFTKAADVGADLVGKNQMDIPEDDPRNPATIADNVGDNVGDCAGMAADVFESYAVTLVAAIILGAAIFPASVLQNSPEARTSVLQLVMFPLAVRAVGVFASIIGVFAVKGKDDATLNPMSPINTGFQVSTLVAAVLTGIVSYYFFKEGVTITVPGSTVATVYPWYLFFICTLSGLVLSLFIGKLTEHFTSAESKPVQEIAGLSVQGAAQMIISGFAYALESSVWSVLLVILPLVLALVLFSLSAPMIAYGIALAGLGLLTTTGFILAMDTFGPITDNAQGIFEMSGVLEDDKREGKIPKDGLSGDVIVSKLDSAGNTTKALTKGFAIATAVIAAVALFRSYMTGAGLTAPADTFTLANAMHDGKIFGIPLDVPEVFIGLLIGGAAPFLFSAFAIAAVGRAAKKLIDEVLRQFREKPGIMARTEKPDYDICVAIVTEAAQKELVAPAVLAIILPILVGFGLGFRGTSYGAAALGGYLAGAILSGQLLAVLLSNAGGAWDNAKKMIEDGAYGGKRSEAHKNAVICDTVGDPFKDTAGPALNPLIKVMNLTGILVAGALTQPIAAGLRVSICLVCVALLVGAVRFSRRPDKEMTLSTVEKFEA